VYVQKSIGVALIAEVNSVFCYASVQKFNFIITLQLNFK